MLPPDTNKKGCPVLSNRTPSFPRLAYLPCGQSGQDPVQSAIAFATAGAAAIAAVLADSSTMAARNFLMIFSVVWIE
jgi:hypothetical protein